MNELIPRASRCVRFEEVTPAHEYATFFSVSIAPLVAHLGLPIFDAYDDLDDLQLAFLTLSSGETVTLGEYAGEPIDCFYHALEIYTRPKLPEYWAMLQHNLGLAYFDRIKGARWENLQKSIQYFNKSLEVFTQETFPKKWQINQEDLSQSLEALKVERQNMVEPIHI
jgi:hypothetical protein